MSAYRYMLMPTTIDALPIRADFDIWNMTPRQKAEVQNCMATGGEFERPEPGQTAAWVQNPTKDGKNAPAQYKGNYKPIVPNIKGAKRAGGMGGIAGGFGFLGGVQTCIQDVANE
jgi:hypothetical protein